MIGQLLGDYLIVARLGKGGFGKVLLGLQRPLYRLKAAVKLVEFGGSDPKVHSRIAQKFEGEAGALAVLQSPHIVRLLQYGVHQGLPFMAMEFIPGSRTLQTEISRMVVGHEALSREVIQRVIDQTLNGLEAAHREGIIHRDIKPENIMLQDVVGDPWFVKLVDFGLAKVIEESRETSLVLGTVHYMAPEQVEAKNLGPWTDLYALGVIAYELLIGHRPFIGKEQQVILREKLNPTFDPVARCAHLELPEVVTAFLRKALHRYPEKRYRSTQEFRAAWAKVFEESQGTVMFSTDLSGLVDSSDHSELKRMESALVRERVQLEAERRLLEEERKKLESERVKVSSGQVGSEAESPAAVESWVIGATKVLDSAVPPTEAPVLAMERGLSAQGPAESTTYISRGFETGPAVGASIAVSPKRARGWLVAAGLVLAGGGGALAVALAGAGDGTPTAAVQVGQVAPSTSRTSPILPEPEPASGSSVGGAVKPGKAPGASSARVDPPSPGPDALSSPHKGTQVASPLSAGVRSEPSPGPAAASPSQPIAKDPAPAPSPATISIESTPAGAAVRVDGVPKGVTPFVLETALGARHRIQVVQGTQVELRDVEVSNPRSQLVVELKPSPRGPTPPNEPSALATHAAPRPQVAKPVTAARPAAGSKPVPPAQPPRPVFVD